MKKIFLLIATVAMSAGVAFAQDINQVTENYNNGAMELQMGNKEAALANFQTALSMAEALGEEGAEIVNNCKGTIPAIMESIAKDLIKAEDYDGAIAQLNQTIEVAGTYGADDVVVTAFSRLRTLLVQQLHSRKFLHLIHQTAWLLFSLVQLIQLRVR